MQLYSDVVQDRNGNVVSGATVTVTLYPAGTSATVYGANAVGANVNPLTTDSNGKFSFYAANGRYSLSIAKTGISTATVSAVLIQDVEVSATEFGAIGDGVTDDYAAITAALANVPSGGVVTLLPGSYRTSATIQIPANRTLAGATHGSILTAGSVEIVGDLAVTPIVQLLASGSAAGALKNLTVSRAAGAVPASSIAVSVGAINHGILSDLYIIRSAIGVKATSAVTLNLNRVTCSQITETHYWLKNTIEVNFHESRAGRNGGLDVNCNEYIRIEGNCDTIRAAQCNFNMSANLATRAIYFDTYNSVNGLISFSQCHFELCTNLVAQTGTTSVPRFELIGASLNNSGTTFNTPAGFFLQMVMTGCPFALSACTFDGAASLKVIGNTFLAAVTLNACQGQYIGNDNNAALTVSGAWTGGVVTGNTMTNGNTITDTHTGQCRVFGNSINGANDAGVVDTLNRFSAVTISHALNNLAYSASITPDASLGDTLLVVATNGVAFTINNPINPTIGQEITLRIANTSGGALGVLTLNAVFKASAWTQPANGFSRSAVFYYNSANWVQKTPQTLDIPN